MQGGWKGIPESERGWKENGPSASAQERGSLQIDSAEAWLGGAGQEVGYHFIVH